MERLNSADERKEILPHAKGESNKAEALGAGHDHPDTILEMLQQHDLLDKVSTDKMLFLDFDINSATVSLQQGAKPSLPSWTQRHKGKCAQCNHDAESAHTKASAITVHSEQVVFLHLNSGCKNSLPTTACNTCCQLGSIWRACHSDSEASLRHPVQPLNRMC